MNRIIPFLAMVLVALGCKNRDPGSYENRSPGSTPKSTGTPLAFELKKKNTISSSAVEKSRPQLEVEGVLVNGAQYVATLNKFPIGTKWRANGKEGVTKSDIYEQINLGDMTPLLGELDLSKRLIDLRFDPKTVVSLELPDGSSGDAPLPASNVSLAVPAALEKIADGPLTFKGEPPDDPKKKALVVVWNTSTLELFGGPATLAEVDKVALVRPLTESKGEVKCEFTSRSLKLVLRETDTVVYDRRTGKELARKRFSPNRACPSMAYVNADQDSIYSDVPENEITTYLKGQVAR
ncbi:MAG: hypothetical protein U0271_29260 [Polyangiaceae bacterium]